MIYAGWTQDIYCWIHQHTKQLLLKTNLLLQYDFNGNFTCEMSFLSCTQITAPHIILNSCYVFFFLSHQCRGLGGTVKRKEKYVNHFNTGMFFQTNVSKYHFWCSRNNDMWNKNSCFQFQMTLVALETTGTRLQKPRIPMYTASTDTKK